LTIILIIVLFYVQMIVVVFIILFHGFIVKVNLGVAKVAAKIILKYLLTFMFIMIMI
jgi:hypothetical protein